MKTQTAKQIVRSPRESKSSLTKSQLALQKEFCAAYGLAAEQISFDQKTGEPIFDFDASMILANTLARIPDITLGLEKFHDDKIKIAESYCRMILNGQMTRKFLGVAVIGERMHDGTIITDVIQAINISRARALRTGFRSVGFIAVKFHEARKEGRQLELCSSDELEYAKYRAEIHVLAGPRGLGFIKSNGDRTEYENLMASFFHGVTTSKDLEPSERDEWRGMLRAWSRGAKAA